ncbi:hypothetical protein ACHQM5_009812 [Ranunculus cassubicifolius]
MPTFEIINKESLELEKTVTEISKDQQELQEVKNGGLIRRPSFSLGGGGGEGEELDENDDGFKTPTSMDHKIPRIKQCPPAPMKLKARSCPMKKKAKRKEMSSDHCFRIDLSKEIQLLFPPLVSDLGGLHKKMKNSTQAAA